MKYSRNLLIMPTDYSRQIRHSIVYVNAAKFNILTMKPLLTLFICFLPVLAFGDQQKQLSPTAMKAFMDKEAYRTNPDYVCFVPGSYDFSTHDSHNEHFLVFDGPNGSLMAVWTQAVGKGNH